MKFLTHRNERLDDLSRGLNSPANLLRTHSQKKYDNDKWEHITKVISQLLFSINFISFNRLIYRVPNFISFQTNSVGREREMLICQAQHSQNNREILIDSEMCFPLCMSLLKSPIDLLLYISPHLLHIYETRSLETLLCRAGGAAVIAVDAKKI